MSAKIAILASGSGTNAQAIIDSAKAGHLQADIELVLCNRPGAKVLERARNAGIRHILLDHREFADRESYDAKVVEILREHDCGIVALAGYMRILSRVFLDAFNGPVLNIHPALLPSFPGTHGIADAWNYGVKITGVSVHFVDEKMDNGPLVIQAAIPVFPEKSLDELEARIHAVEHRIYPQALQWLVSGRLKLDGRKTLLSPAACKLAEVPENIFIWPPLEEGF